MRILACFCGLLLLASVLCLPNSTVLGQTRPTRGPFTPLPTSPIRLLAMQNVHRELRLSAQQQARLDRLARNLLAARTTGTAPGGRQSAMENFAANVDTITSTENRIVEQELAKLLSEEQAARLKQLTIQYQGVDALATPHVAKELELTARQQERIQRIRKEIFAVKSRQLQEALVRPNSVAALQARMVAIERESRQRVDALLTGDQRAKYKEMKGKPYHGFVVLPRQR